MDRTLPGGGRSIGAVLLLVALLIAGCAGGAAASPNAQPGASGGPAAAPTAPGGGRGEDGEPGSQAGAPKPGLPAGGGGGDNGAFRDLAKIVYTGSMSIRVADLQGAVRAGRDAVLTAGGYVGSSRQSNDGERSTASITYRIPADRWEETLETLRSLGTVLAEEVDSAEVTGQLVDLEARIRNLRIQEASVREIAEQASGFEEILEGQERLAEIRGQIEQLDAQRANLEDRADLGTLTATFGTEAVAVTAAAEEAAWDARGEIARATETLVGVLEALSTAGIWFGIVWLPILLILVLLALLARLVLRRTGILGRFGEEMAGPPVARG